MNGFMMLPARNVLSAAIGVDGSMMLSPAAPAQVPSSG